MAGELKKSVFTREHGIGAMIAALAACIPILTGAFALDARYMKVEDADNAHQALTTQASEKHFHQDKEREEGDLRTRLDLINNRIKYLNKQPPSPDVVDELDYLRSQRKIILERLGELEQA